MPARRVEFTSQQSDDKRRRGRAIRCSSADDVSFCLKREGERCLRRTTQQACIRVADRPSEMPRFTCQELRYERCEEHVRVFLHGAPKAPSRRVANDVDMLRASHARAEPVAFAERLICRLMPCPAPAARYAPRALYVAALHMSVQRSAHTGMRRSSATLLALRPEAVRGEGGGEVAVARG